MAPLVYVVAILGCGDVGSCETVRTLPTPYASQSACTAATDVEVQRNRDVDFPVIVARCIVAGGRPAALKASEVKLPGPGSAPVRVSPVTG
jgi:hypothetical protein